MVIGDSEQWTRAAKMIKDKDSMPEDKIQYIPPHIQDGQVQGAVLVSEGEVVEKPEVVVNREEITEAADTDGIEKALAVNSSVPSVLEEVEGETE